LDIEESFQAHWFRFPEAGGFTMQIPNHLKEKLLDRFASVVTGHVGVGFAPQPFDVIVSGTIGWQEMKVEDPSFPSQGGCPSER
jgi:hypothetical protein